MTGTPATAAGPVVARHPQRAPRAPRASELRCPALLTVGRHDPQTPVRVSRALHARIDGSQLVIFERSGHSPFIEEPERFAQVLTGFLR